MPTCSLYPQQKRDYSALHPQAWTHACRHLPSAVPWISEDRLFARARCSGSVSDCGCLSFCCLTSTEARRPTGDGDEWEKGDRRVRPRNRRQPGRPRLPWTAARIAVSVRHCVVTIPHHAVAVPTAMQNKVTKTVDVCMSMCHSSVKVFWIRPWCRRHLVTTQGTWWCM